MKEDTGILWIIAAAVAGYFIYQAVQSAGAASSTATATGTVPYYTMGANGDLQYNTGGTPGEYAECDPLHGYPQVPCQVGSNAGTGAQGAQGPGSPASW